MEVVDTDDNLSEIQKRLDEVTSLLSTVPQSQRVNLKKQVQDLSALIEQDLATGNLDHLLDHKHFPLFGDEDDTKSEDDFDDVVAEFTGVHDDALDSDVTHSAGESLDEEDDAADADQDESYDKFLVAVAKQEESSGKEDSFNVSSQNDSIFENSQRQRRAVTINMQQIHTPGKFEENSDGERISYCRRQDYLGGRVQCAECGKICYRKINWIQHLWHNHNIRVIIDGKPVVIKEDRPSLKLTVKFYEAMPQGDPRICEICQRQFTRTVTWVQHMKFMHALKMVRDTGEYEEGETIIEFRDAKRLRKAVGGSEEPQPSCSQDTEESVLNTSQELEVWEVQQEAGDQATDEVTVEDISEEPSEQAESIVNEFIKMEESDEEEEEDEEGIIKEELDDEELVNDGGIKRREIPYMCGVCYKPFLKEIGLKQHMTRQHPELTDLPCKDCGQVFPNTKKLFQHIRLHHSGKKLMCDKCTYSTKHPVDLRRHTLRYHRSKDEYPFQCLLCKTRYLTGTQLRQHQASIHEGEKRPFIKCQIPGCDYGSVSKTTMYQHHRNVHLKSRKLYPCRICGKKLKSKDTMETHVRRHLGEYIFQCDQCSASFPCRTQFANHVRTHGGKAFTCTLCNRAFNTKANLQRHMLVHTGEKNHQCPWCTYRCSMSSNLRKHCQARHGQDYPRNSATRVPLEVPVLKTFTAGPSLIYSIANTHAENSSHETTNDSHAGLQPARAKVLKGIVQSGPRLKLALAGQASNDTATSSAQAGLAEAQKSSASAILRNLLNSNPSDQVSVNIDHVQHDNTKVCTASKEFILRDSVPEGSVVLSSLLSGLNVPTVHEFTKNPSEKFILVQTTDAAGNHVLQLKPENGVTPDDVELLLPGDTEHDQIQAGSFSSQGNPTEENQQEYHVDSESSVAVTKTNMEISDGGEIEEHKLNTGDLFTLAQPVLGSMMGQTVSGSILDTSNDSTPLQVVMLPSSVQNQFLVITQSGTNTVSMAPSNLEIKTETGQMTSSEMYLNNFE